MLAQNRRVPRASLPQSMYNSRSSGEGSKLIRAYQVRSSTAEHLYIVLQSKDLGWEPDEQVEEILLETEWYDRLSEWFLTSVELSVCLTGRLGMWIR